MHSNLHVVTGNKGHSKLEKKMYLVWPYRLLTAPQKQIKRLKTIPLTFPKMLKEEKARHQ